jgi:WD40 repeat protein
LANSAQHTEPEPTGPEPIDRTQTLAPKSDRSATPPATPATAATGSRAATDRAAAIQLPTDDPERYRPAGEHARGGLGRVIRALDTRLGRTVAVKELLRTSPAAEALFVREALITARLQHPGIVPVHEAGRWPSGEPYYVMKLVQGRTLKEVIAERATLAERLALLPHAIAVADAVGYAHSHDVIHRDLKPANVMVGDHGETVVVDWGLARDGRRDVAEPCDGVTTTTSGSSGDRTSTVSGRVIGTPQYMPPEQARGEPVDERGDVYALGALLYELLAGKPPYGSGTGPRGVLEEVIAGPPRPLASLVADLPRDLDAIVTKAMARDRERRYRDAKALADDLKRFQSGQLVSAQTYGTVALVRRWMVRNRGPVAVAAIGALILIGVAIGLVRRILDERNVARDATARAEDARGAAESRQHDLTLLQARASLDRDPTAAVAWLKSDPSAVRICSDVGAMIDEAVANGVAKHVWRQRDWVYDAQFSPDGAHVATASKDGDVRVYDTRTGGFRVLGRHAAGIRTIAFTPDGTALATGGLDGAIQLWPLAGGAPRVLGQQGDAVAGLKFVRAGTRLLTASEGGPPREWDVAKGGGGALFDLDQLFVAVVVPDDAPDAALAAGLDGALWRRTGRAGQRGPEKIITIAGGISALGVTRDGSHALVSDGRALLLIDIAHGTSIPVGDSAPQVKSIAFARDGLTAAVVGEDRDVTLVDIAARTSRRLRGHTDAIYHAVFSRDGHRLLTASDDGTARIWDLESNVTRVLRGHDDDVLMATFSPDEREVVTASLDGSARLWSLARQELAILGGGSESIQRITLVDGGKRALTVSLPGRSASWDLVTGARTELFRGDGRQTSWAKPHLPALSHDGRWVAIPLDDGTIAAWHDGVGPQAFVGHTSWVVDGGFAPDDRVMYSGARDGTVRAWALATGASTVVYRGDPIWGVAIAPDGQRLAIGTGAHILLITTDGKRLASTTLDAAPPIGCTRGLQFDPHGVRVATGRCDGHLLVWDPAAGAPIDLQTAAHSVTSFVFSADGARIAGAMADRTVRVWDAISGRALTTLRGHTDLVMAVAFSPDGTRLASASYDRTIRIWDPTTGAARVLRGHDASVEAIAWTDDGARLVSGGRDGTLRVWAAPSLLQPNEAAVGAVLAGVTSATIGGDDRPATPPETTPAG